MESTSDTTARVDQTARYDTLDSTTRTLLTNLRHYHGSLLTVGFPTDPQQGDPEAARD